VTTRREPICGACKLFRGSPLERPTCSAFPDGIPDRILDGFDHRQPFPGDGGTRFVRDPDKPMPPDFPEKLTPQNAVLLVETGTIRNQTKAQLRERAKGIIAQLREQQ
jgi:hypothetical protein